MSTEDRRAAGTSTWLQGRRFRARRVRRLSRAERVRSPCQSPARFVRRRAAVVAMPMPGTATRREPAHRKGTLFRSQGGTAAAWNSFLTSCVGPSARSRIDSPPAREQTTIVPIGHGLRGEAIARARHEGAEFHRAARAHARPASDARSQRRWARARSPVRDVVRSLRRRARSTIDASTAPVINWLSIASSRLSLGARRPCRRRNQRRRFLARGGDSAARRATAQDRSRRDQRPASIAASSSSRCAASAWCRAARSSVAG